MDAPCPDILTCLGVFINIDDQIYITVLQSRVSEAIGEILEGDIGYYTHTVVSTSHLHKETIASLTNRKVEISAKKDIQKTRGYALLKEYMRAVTP